MKKILTSPLLVGHFDPNLAPVILTDFSKFGIAFCLFQFKKVDGLNKATLVSSGSRSLTNSEKTWSSTEGELLAAVYALLKLKHWIYGSNLVFLQTDHRPLIQIFSKDLDSIANALTKIVKDHINTPMAGRTHLQHALPVPFGYKAATWLSSIDRHIKRLEEIKSFPLDIINQSDSIKYEVYFTYERFKYNFWML